MAVATIIGGPVSPYVRKVMAVCNIKGVPFQADPIIPFQGNDAFTQVSPLRRIPVFFDDQVTLADSTAIGEYLDERYPTPPLFPKTPAARAKARWIEEFADTRMGDVFIWRLFNVAVIRPAVWKEARDDAAIAETLRTDLPSVMDYLESIAPDDGFVFGELAVADLAVAVHFANLRWARTDADLTPWPKTMAWIDRVEATPAVANLTNLAARAMTTRNSERRALRRTGDCSHRDDFCGRRPPARAYERLVFGNDGFRAGPRCPLTTLSRHSPTAVDLRMGRPGSSFARRWRCALAGWPL